MFLNCFVLLFIFICLKTVLHERMSDQKFSILVYFMFIFHFENAAWGTDCRTSVSKYSPPPPNFFSDSAHGHGIDTEDVHIGHKI